MEQLGTDGASATDVAKDVGQDAFPVEVVQASGERTIVVDFWAPWCGPCHQLSPVLERVAARHAGEIDLVKVNVDEAPQLARTYQVQGIPAVKAFRDGKVVAEFVGAQPEQAVERFFAALAPSEADRLVLQARAAGDAAEAEQALRAALEREPGHRDAAVALAEALIARGETDEAQTLLGRVPGDAQAERLLAELRLGGAIRDEAALAQLRSRAAAGDAGAALELGRALAAGGAHEEALAALLDAVRDPAERDEARAAMLEVFALLGPDHPLVRQWRPKLAAALF